MDAVVVSCEKLFQSWPDEVKRQWSERGLVTADPDSFPPPSLLVTEG